MVHTLHTEVFLTTFSVNDLALNRLSIIKFEIVSQSFITGEGCTDDGLLGLTADSLNRFGTFLVLIEWSRSILFYSSCIEGECFLQRLFVCLSLSLLTRLDGTMFFFAWNYVIESISQDRLFCGMFSFNELSILEILIDPLTE